MVVCLHLKTQRPAAVKINYPGIIHKNRKAPRLVQLPGRLHDGTLQQVVYRLPVVPDFPLECLVDAVFRPGLGQRLQFHVNGVSPLLPEVVDNGLKLVPGKAEPPGKPRFIRGGNIHLFPLKPVLRVFRKAELRPLDDVLDDGIHQQPAADDFKFPPVQLPGNKIPPGRFGRPDIL